MNSKIHEIVKKYTKITDFDSDSDLQMDLDMDSFNLVCLAVEMEEAFAIKIGDSDIYNLLTVGDIEEYIKNQISEK